MAAVTEADRTRKIVAAERQPDGRLLVTVETTATHTVLMDAVEWSAKDAKDKGKAKGKSAILNVVSAAMKAAKL